VVQRDRALVMIEDEQYRPAAALLRAKLDLVDKTDRRVYQRPYVRALLLAGEPLEAYRTAPQAAEAFRQIAPDLLSRMRGAAKAPAAAADKSAAPRLRELLAAHRQRQPGDPRAD